MDQWNSIDMSEQLDQIPAQFLDPNALSVPNQAIFVDKQQSAHRKDDGTDISELAAVDTDIQERFNKSSQPSALAEPATSKVTDRRGIQKGNGDKKSDGSRSTVNNSVQADYYLGQEAKQIMLDGQH